MKVQIDGWRLTPNFADLPHQGWYLNVANNGRIDTIPLAGNPVLGDEQQT